IGAQFQDGTGPIQSLHDAEWQLAATGCALTIVRAAYFMENWVPVLGATADGLLPTFLPPSLRIPMVASRDIGVCAAGALVEGGKGRKVVELSGPREYSADDVAGALAALVSRPVHTQPAPLGAHAACAARCSRAAVHRDGRGPRSRGAVSRDVRGHRRRSGRVGRRHRARGSRHDRDRGGAAAGAGDVMRGEEARKSCLRQLRHDVMLRPMVPRLTQRRNRYGRAGTRGPLWPEPRGWRAGGRARSRIGAGVISTVVTRCTAADVMR